MFVRIGVRLKKQSRLAAARALSPKIEGGSVASLLTLHVVCKRELQTIKTKRVSLLFVFPSAVGREGFHFLNCIGITFKGVFRQHPAT
jgi:hypothetical protein